MDFKKELRIQYKKSFDYLKKSKKYIYVAFWVFLIFLILGFIIPLPEGVSKQILDYFKEIVMRTQDYSSFKMISFLFKNNAMATFVGLFSGVAFGVFSAFNLIMNGFVLGFAASYSVAENGLLSLLRLLPHGIFELPAVFISLGLGIKLGTFVFKKDKKKSLREYFNNSIRVYFLIVLPLLVIAALIEGFLITLSSLS